MTSDPRAAFDLLRNTPFMSLTTFRRSGETVATAVWVAGDGADLVVITPGESGKVKRMGVTAWSGPGVPA